MMIDTVYVVGPPGAGKTTLAKALAGAFQCAHLSGGDVARELAATDPETAQALERGEMAKRPVMDNLIWSRIIEGVKQGMMVVDGYPRYPAQLEAASSRRRASILIHLSTPIALCFYRLRERNREDYDPKREIARMQTYLAETAPMVVDLFRSNTGWTVLDCPDAPLQERIITITRYIAMRRSIDASSN